MRTKIKKYNRQLSRSGSKSKSKSLSLSLSSSWSGSESESESVSESWSWSWSNDKHSSKSGDSELYKIIKTELNHVKDRDIFLLTDLAETIRELKKD